VFKTPPYRDTSITEPVNVFLQLHRPSSGDLGDPKPFMYRPADQGKPAYVSVGSRVNHITPAVLSLFILR